MASDPTAPPRCSSPEPRGAVAGRSASGEAERSLLLQLGASSDAGAEDSAAVAALDAAEKSSGRAIDAGPEEEPVAPAERIPRPGVLPLLGKPYFSCIMCKSHVQQPFQVVVPRSLAPFLPTRTAPATLCWRGRSWGMRFTGGRLIQRLEAGWRGFAVDNDLRLGDGCLFELVDGERVEFRVQVLRAEIPAKIRGRAGGYTSATPIVIDD